MHSYGAADFQSIAHVHLRETVQLSATLTIVVFGKCRTVTPHSYPDILRRRFHGFKIFFCIIHFGFVYNVS